MINSVSFGNRNPITNVRVFASSSPFAKPITSAVASDPMTIKEAAALLAKNFPSPLHQVVMRSDATTQEAIAALNKIR